MNEDYEVMVSKEPFYVENEDGGITAAIGIRIGDTVAGINIEDAIVLAERILHCCHMAIAGRGV